MTDPAPPKEKEPLVNLSPLVRELAAMLLVVLAAVHVAWPHSGIDFEFFGLLGFAVVILFLDIESIEWLGIRLSRRRQIEAAVAAVEESALRTMRPPTPPLHETDLASDVSLIANVPQADEEEFGAPHDPMERLLWGYEQIRIELIIIAGNSGGLPERADWSYLPDELIVPLREAWLLPPGLETGIREVILSRNEAVNGKLSKVLIKPSADLAVKVFKKLHLIKRYYIRVRHHDVVLYADQELKHPLSEKGVVLAQIDWDGNLRSVDAFPTQEAYTKGRFVSWKWTGPGVNAQTWYKDPKTNAAISAFSTSLFFAGRQYPEEWRLETRLGNPSNGLA